MVFTIALRSHCCVSVVGEKGRAGESEGEGRRKGEKKKQSEVHGWAPRWVTLSEPRASLRQIQQAGDALLCSPLPKHFASDPISVLRGRGWAQGFFCSLEQPWKRVFVKRGEGEHCPRPFVRRRSGLYNSK